MRRTWTWTFDLPPDELWPVLADTNRFNEAMGLPPYVLEETPQANGTILRRGKRQGGGLHARMGGEALRVDPRPPLPPGPRLHQGPVPPLRAGVRSRAGRRRRQQGELRPRMGAAHPDGPPVRRAAGAPRRARWWASASSKPSPSPRASARPISTWPRPSCPTARASGRRRSPPRSTAAPTATASAGRWPTSC